MRLEAKERKGRGKEMLKEFREFSVKGNMVDMAVGIIIGAAFGSVVTSFVADNIMPPIGLLLGNVNFSDLIVVLREGKAPGPYASVAAAKAAGAVTLNYGLFINTLISFLVVAFSVFLLVRNINKLRKEQATPEIPATKECPYCLSIVPLAAVRCGHCTSELKNPSKS
jgi:large conductance mechanosensitive channel